MGRVGQQAGRGGRVVSGVAALVLLAGVACPEHLSAEERPTWTLEELVQTALDRNPGLAATREAVTAAEEDVAAAKGERWPKLDAVGLGEYFPRRERLLIFRHGFRDDDNPFANAIVNYGLEVTLPLYTSGRITGGIALAESLAETARFRVGLTRQELIFNVASTYHTALGLQDVIAAQEATLESLTESLRIARIQREVGRIAPLDLLRIETRVAQAEEELVSARNAYDQVIEILKDVINLPPETVVDVTGELTPAPSEFDVVALRDQALAGRPDLIALRHEVQAQEEAVAIAGAALGPQLDLFADYRGVTAIDERATKDDARIFLQLRIPIYEGGVLRAQRRKAQAQLREIELRLHEAERRALAEVERAALDLQASAPRITAGRRGVEQGQEALRVERERLEQGRGTANDLLLAEEALLRARTDLAAALADSQIARAALNLAAGEEPVPVGPPPSEPVHGND